MTHATSLKDKRYAKWRFSMIYYSINDALDARASFHGSVIGISGLLTFEFEETSINHWWFK